MCGLSVSSVGSETEFRKILRKSKPAGMNIPVDPLRVYPLSAQGENGTAGRGDIFIRTRLQKILSPHPAGPFDF